MAGWGGKYPKRIESLGDRLRAARIRNGIALKDFAARLGLDRHTVARWEKNRAVPRGKALSEAMGILGLE